MGDSETGNDVDRGRVPRTPPGDALSAKALCTRLAPYRLLHGVINGQSVYAYKDTHKGFAYVGGPTDFHRYQELSYQEQKGRVDYVQEEMSTQMASGWYDAWSGRTGLSGGPLEVNVPKRVKEGRALFALSVAASATVARRCPCLAQNVAKDATSQSRIRSYKHDGPLELAP